MLVNAAGGNRPDATLPPCADFCKLPLDAWQGVFELNLVGGALLPSQVFGQAMLTRAPGQYHQHRVDGRHESAVARGGLLGGQGSRHQPHAIFGARMGYAGRASERDQPGIFPAEQNRALLFKPDGSFTERGGAIVGHTPMARFGQPQELAGAVVWLAARRASSFVTGQNIVVDGGFSATSI